MCKSRAACTTPNAQRSPTHTRCSTCSRRAPPPPASPCSCRCCRARRSRCAAGDKEKWGASFRGAFGDRRRRRSTQHCCSNRPSLHITITVDSLRHLLPWARGPAGRGQARPGGPQQGQASCPGCDRQHAVAVQGKEWRATASRSLHPKGQHRRLSSRLPQWVTCGLALTPMAFLCLGPPPCCKP